MRRAVFGLIGIGLISGCVAAPGAESSLGESRDGGIGTDISIRPKSRPDDFQPIVIPTAAPKPPTAADTAEEFDTTTQAQREEAAAAPVDVGEKPLGTTIASLGSPTEPGFWLKTPLVTQPTQGRVVYPQTGKSVQVTLIPIEGPATAGSRMSLPALRLIEAPLTGLPEVQVFADT